MTSPNEEQIRFADLFSEIELTPHGWVTDGNARWGQQYLRVDRDKDGRVISRKVLEPVGWISCK